MISSAILETQTDKLLALQANKFAFHYYNYSDNVHGYAVFLNGTFNIIINKNKTTQEKIMTELRLRELVVRHIDKELILIHGEGGEVLTASRSEDKMSMTIFELKNIIENLHQRGVQEDGC